MRYLPLPFSLCPHRYRSIPSAIVLDHPESIMNGGFQDRHQLRRPPPSMQSNLSRRGAPTSRESFKSNSLPPRPPRRTHSPTSGCLSSARAAAVVISRRSRLSAAGKNRTLSAIQRSDSSNLQRGSGLGSDRRDPGGVGNEMTRPSSRSVRPRPSKGAGRAMTITIDGFVVWET